MPDDSDLFDVVVIGAGAAGLQAASHLLQTKPSLRVLILERSSVSGGRIRDVKLADGIEMTGLGAWRVDGSVKMTSELFRSHGVELREWSYDVKRVEANGVCVGSLQELRAQAFPHIPETSDVATLDPHYITDFLKKLLGPSIMRAAKEGKPLPTKMADIVREALDEDSHRFLTVLSHGYKMCAEYDMDIVGTIGPANVGSSITRPLDGMSVLIKILERDCLEKGAEIRHRALVNRLVRIRSLTGDSSVLYEIGYIRTRGRILPGSDTEAANDFDPNSEQTVIRTRSVILAIPPAAISRLANQETSPSASSILHSLCHHPTFLSCQSLPAFRAVALYDRPWWDDDIHSLPPLGKRGTLFSASSRSSHIMSYEGRGPNGEAALHVAYASDKASMDFWGDAVRDVLRLGSSSHTGDRDRHPEVDEAMYRYIRLELAKAFLIPHEDIPHPLRLEWHYWDDGVVHVQRNVDGQASISRKELESWAVGAPLSWRDEDGVVRTDRVVLAGEGFAEDWGWVEGALHSAVQAANTGVTWFGE